ncbi:MAG: hypothetical protein LBU78_05265, partial [Microbacterium sp.]|nr:hypothetical protein [Microbacterium sp.]
MSSSSSDGEQVGQDAIWSSTPDKVVISGAQKHPKKVRADGGKPGKSPGTNTENVGYIPPPGVFDPLKCLDVWDDQRGCYRLNPEEDEATPETPAPTPGFPAITITDLASFAPKGAVLT